MDVKHNHSYKVLQILTKYYKHIYTLEEYVKKVLADNDLNVCLMESSDAASFINLLKTTLVCVDETTTPKILSINNYCHQREIVLRVIQRLINRDSDKKNVLTLGSHEPSKNSKLYVSQLSQVEIQTSCQSSRLMYPLWTQLLERIGDNLMSFIIEFTAVYINVSSSCLVQITGTPLFDLPICKEESSKRGRKRKYPFAEKDDESNRNSELFMTDKMSPEERQLRQSDKHLVFDYHRYIPRTRSLYDSSVRETFVSSFPLTSLEPTMDDACRLFRTVFDHSLKIFPSMNATSGIFSNMVKKLENMFKEMIGNHRKCPYRSLLDHYCPVHIVNTRRRKLSRKFIKGRSSLTRAAGSVVMKYSQSIYFSAENIVHNRKVFLFLRQLVLRIFPESLLGSTRNYNHFLTHIKKFISLGKYERYSLGQLMRNLKIRDCKWLASLKPYSLKIQIFSELVWFLFCQIVIGWLKTFLYMTDSTVYKNKIFYYRKSVWQSMKSKAINGFIKKCHLQHINESTVEEWINDRRCLGVSKIRFTPKGKSLRPIINMSDSSTGLGKYLSINKQLQNCLHILRYEKEKQDITGRAVFGVDEIYKTWKSFVMVRKEKSDTRKLYFVKTDIDKCFDTINQEKLMHILQEIFSQVDEYGYIPKKYCMIYKEAENVRQRFYNRIFTLTDYSPDFCKFVKEVQNLSNINDVILIDQGYRYPISVEHLMKQLECHICRNVIKIGQHYYVQKKGISQGSVLSTSLCNLYYGNMENERIRIDTDELLMRMVDDTLFITPHRDRAIKYLQTMLKDIPDYNCHLNQDKTLINFTFNNIKQLKANDLFPWCGMLFDPTSLNIHVDYSRYAGVSLQSTMAFNLSQNPGQAMKSKLLFSLKHSCHGIYIDRKINSLEAVIENVFRMFLLMAFRFHSLASRLPFKQRVDNNPKFFLGMISDIISHFYIKATKKMKQVSPDSLFDLNKEHVHRLGFEAFIQKLVQHHSQYKSLIRFLRTELNVVKNKTRNWDRRIAKLLVNISSTQEFVSI